jgi:hypothetical protein
MRTAIDDLSYVPIINCFCLVSVGPDVYGRISTHLRIPFVLSLRYSLNIKQNGILNPLTEVQVFSCLI